MQPDVMRITHVVPHIDQEASGPSYSVPRLCQSLAECGNEIELKCLAASGPIHGVRLCVHRQWPMSGKFAVSTDLARDLRRESHSVDIVHNHSLWSMVNVAAGCVVPGHRAKLVTSPRGTLAAVALSRRKYTKKALWVLQRRALLRADLLHATSEIECSEIRALGIGVPIMVVPNGVDIPPGAPLREPRSERTLLYLSRIHPKKGIDDLLHAWRLLQSIHTDWRLLIVGTGERAHVSHVKQLAASLGVQRIEFPGPLYGDDKTRMYTRADLFILPTFTENFGMVVAEALAHGCPAIVSRGAPWAGLEREGCGWWVDRNTDALTQSLDMAMRMPPARLAEMGVRGRIWMQRDFSWPAIGNAMDSAYRWLLDGGEAPACIRLQSSIANARGAP